MVLVCQAPVGFGLRLDPGYAVKHHHRTVQHAQRTAHLHVEVDVAGRVDQVDLVVAPGNGGGGAVDGDAPRPLLRVVVHGGVAVMHFTGAVDFAGGEQHPFTDRGLARIDVGNDADIAKLPRARVGSHTMLLEDPAPGLHVGRPKLTKATI